MVKTAMVIFSSGLKSTTPLVKLLKNKPFKFLNIFLRTCICNSYHKGIFLILHIIAVHKVGVMLFTIIIFIVCYSVIKSFGI